MRSGMRFLAASRARGNSDMRDDRMGMGNGMDYRMNNGMDMRGAPGYDRDRRGRFSGEMEMNRTYEYGPRNGMGMENETESRFRNHWGPEHGGSMNGYDNMESHWMPPYYGEGNMEMNRYGGNDMEMEQRNPVGFAAHFDSPGKSDASYRSIQEGNRMKGPSMQGRGGAMSQAIPKFNRRMAEEWTGKMKNEDGSKGPHWTMDQTKQMMKQKGIDCDETEFYAVLNAMYSDFSGVAQKHGVHKQDFYLDLAKAFLEDKDAVKDKAAAYYMYIVKR